ncbi:spermidine synthase [Agromyces badenianii]|uniref:spermidine synthase n=1 Tax=Agromyces badenianii TaxID=2080742 RepID=UPI000D58E25A|nr:fused MFS/spermidine synthase [Agromyces badenianii]PWC03927.1 spermine synthase [Agromyces badenianii]
METPPTLETAEYRAELQPDRGSNGGFSLVIDDVTQSHVNPDDPLDLQLPYVRRIAAALSALPVGEPAVLHLGAGGLTLPRYVHALHPRSRQRVVELHPELLEFVTRHLPLPEGAPIEFAIGDARAEVQRLRAVDDANWDLVLVDIFAGGIVPRHVTTLEFFEELVSLLSPGGVLIVNCLNGAEPRVTGDTLAAVLDVLPQTLAIASEAVLMGVAPGNTIIVASRHPLDAAAVARRLAADPVSVATGAAVVDGKALEMCAGEVRRDALP